MLGQERRRVIINSNCHYVRLLLKLSLCVHSRDWHWGNTVMLYMDDSSKNPGNLVKLLSKRNAMVKKCLEEGPQKCYISRTWHSESTRGCYGKEGNRRSLRHNTTQLLMRARISSRRSSCPAVRLSCYYTWKIFWIHRCNWTQCNSTF